MNHSQNALFAYNMKQFIDQLHQKLQHDLPGETAQYEMAHGTRGGKEGAPASARQAGVLALFYPKDKDWNLVFIERVANKNDRHSGQISFPGGSYDDLDITLDRTALREAEEEVGIEAKHIELLGALSTLYIPVSNFHVHPFVGFIDYAPQFKPQHSEVQSIIEVPFSTFLKKETRQKTDLKIMEQILLKDVPYFNINNKIIWGATAMMMSELVAVSQSPSNNY